MAHVLHAAAAAGARMGAGLVAPFRAGADDPLAARLDHLATRTQDPGFDLFAGQGAADEPGAPLGKGNAATIVGQAFDAELLLLAQRDLRRTHAATGLEAQAAGFLGHQRPGVSYTPVDR
ncbi:hypothetical protein D9M69_719740 [compost metagenome]